MKIMSRLKEEQKKIESIAMSNNLQVIHIFPKEGIYVYAYLNNVYQWQWFWNNSIQPDSSGSLDECRDNFYKYYSATANVKFID